MTTFTNTAYAQVLLIVDFAWEYTGLLNFFVHKISMLVALLLSVFLTRISGSKQYSILYNIVTLVSVQNFNQMQLFHRLHHLNNKRYKLCADFGRLHNKTCEYWNKSHF